MGDNLSWTVREKEKRLLKSQRLRREYSSYKDLLGKYTKESERTQGRLSSLERLMKRIGPAYEQKNGNQLYGVLWWAEFWTINIIALKEPLLGERQFGSYEVTVLAWGWEEHPQIPLE